MKSSLFFLSLLLVMACGGSSSVAENNAKFDFLVGEWEAEDPEMGLKGIFEKDGDGIKGEFIMTYEGQSESFKQKIVSENDEWYWIGDDFKGEVKSKVIEQTKNSVTVEENGKKKVKYEVSDNKLTIYENGEAMNTFIKK